MKKWRNKVNNQPVSVPELLQALGSSETLLRPETILRKMPHTLHD